jgi:hypothetical protein
VGPLLIGRLSDALKTTHGVDALRTAAVASTGFYLLAAILMFLCVNRLRSDWVEDVRPA